MLNTLDGNYRDAIEFGLISAALLALSYLYGDEITNYIKRKSSKDYIKKSYNP